MICVREIGFVRGGALQLHLPIAKFQLQHLAGSRTLIFVSQMRNVIATRHLTACANADTRLTPKEFYDPCRNQKIAIPELSGVESYNDFI